MCRTLANSWKMKMFKTLSRAGRRLSLVTAAAVSLFTLDPRPQGCAAELDRFAQAKQVLDQASQLPLENLREIHVVLLADEKDHGPAGNGTHDYPLWQKQWTPLLGGGGLPRVRVTTAWHWPGESDFQTADVIVAYCYLQWSEPGLAQVRRFLERGGGLVLVHSATWVRGTPSPAVADLVGVGGFKLYRHGPLHLDIAVPEHPICLGLPPVVTLEEDESYWPPTPLADGVTVLATSVEEHGAKGSTPKAAQPMFWCRQVGKGRVFGCVPGHFARTFDNPFFRIFLLRGMAWAAGELPRRFDEAVLASPER